MMGSASYADRRTRSHRTALGRFAEAVNNQNVVLLGEVDPNKADPESLVEVSLEEILEKQAVQQAEKEEADKIRAKAFKDRGLTFTTETTYDDMY